jgi:hypothetical protein
MKEGVLHADDSLQKVAGFLKARHISGYGGAVAAITGGRVYRDSNGTSNYDCMHDITRNRDGLNQYMSIGERMQSPDKPVLSTNATPLPPQTETPPISSPNHPDKALHAMYVQALSHLQQLGPSGGFKSRQELEQAAAAVAVDAKATGLSEINHVSRTTAPNGQTFLVAVQGDPTSAAAKNSYIDCHQAVNRTVEDSTAMAQRWQQASQPQTVSQASPTPDNANRTKTV